MAEALTFFFTFLAGVAAGLGVAYSNTGTRTGNGITAMAYIAAVGIGMLAVITGGMR